MRKKVLIILFFIVILFGGFSCLNNVRAQDETVSKLSITKPNKTSYVIGEKIELAGMKVVASYSDGTEKDVTNECTFGWTILCDGAGNHDGGLTYKKLEELLNEEEMEGRKVSDKEREYTVVAEYEGVQSEDFTIKIINDVTSTDKKLPNTGAKPFGLIIVLLSIVLVILYGIYVNFKK